MAIVIDASVMVALLLRDEQVWRFWTTNTGTTGQR